jgi:hypothetical protein
VLSIGIERLTDEHCLTFMQYGTRLFNDTRNGAKKTDWAGKSLEDAFGAFLVYLNEPRTRAVGERGLPEPIALAIREYLEAKRTAPAWKKAESKAWPDSKKKPRPTTLDALRAYLVTLSGKPVDDAKWATVVEPIEANAKAIEVRRAELVEEGSEEAEDLF